MDHIDTLITARWVIPVEPAQRVLENHAVAIARGRIVGLVPEEQARRRFAADEVVARPNHVLLPGLVNAHTHSAMTLLRGAAESASSGLWLHREIRPLERRWLDADYVRDGAMLAMAEMLKGGVTCFADMHLFPEIVAQSAAEARMRACVGLPVTPSPTVWAGTPDECLEKGLTLHDVYRDDPLITTALAPFEPASLDDAALARIRRNADELDIPMTLHVNETQAETHDGAERFIARLERLGLVSPLLAAIHAVHLEPGEMAQLASAGASVVHCPQANLKLGAGVCRTADLAAAGVNVALGSGGAASNNDLDMLDEMRTAALLARGVHRYSAPRGAHDWLQAATLNGARALGLGDAVGSLSPGKWADVCCIDLHYPQTQPVHDIAAQILYAAGREQVCDVWVAGRALLRERELTTIDLTDVLHRAAEWGERIRGSLET